MPIRDIVVSALLLAASGSWGADMTVEQVRATIASATQGAPAQFAGKDLWILTLLHRSGKRIFPARACSEPSWYSPICPERI
jgi:hypothetical protein